MLAIEFFTIRIFNIIQPSSNISKFPRLSKHVTGLIFLVRGQALIVALPINNKLNALTAVIGIVLTIHRPEHIFPSRRLIRVLSCQKIMVHERFVLIHGCDIACKIHVAASTIDGKRSAIELETCFILDIDITARRFDNTIVLARVRAAKERRAICARHQ